MNITDMNTAADVLFAAVQSQALFAGFPVDIRPHDEKEAYQVQDLLLKRLVQLDGVGFAGHKIGSTTPVMQEYLGIANPCAGRLRQSMTHHARAEFHPRGRAVLGVECEIAVRIGTDLPPSGAPYDHAGVVGAVGTCMAAIEVVEDRYVDWRSLDTPTLIADNFFNVGAVTGTEFTDFDPVDLDTVTASMTIDGVVVGEGRGSDVLGHPLDALVWLANNASARGIALSTGEIVLLGSLVETHWVAPGSRVRIDNSRFGTAEAFFV